MNIFRLKIFPPDQRRRFDSGRSIRLFYVAIGIFIISLMPVLAAPANGQDSAPQFEAIEKIDVHVHIFDDLPEFVAMLERTNTRIINICVGASQPGLMELCEQRAEQLHQQYGEQIHFAATFDLTRRNAPDYAAQVNAWLDTCFRAGAVMVKLWKEVGMSLSTPTGSFLMPDDPRFDPIYERLTLQNRPLMMHVADPIDAWLTPDPKSAHYSYYQQHPEWRIYGKKDFPGHGEILAARDRVLAKHPTLKVIAAHLGSEAHDLDQLAQRLEQFPNLYADVSARTFELQRLPAVKVRQFFIRFQDRLLYGTDRDKYTEGRLPTPEERSAFTAAMEKVYRDDYRYYAGQGSFMIGKNKVACLHLPSKVLAKFYHQNAINLIFNARSEK